MIEYYKIFNWLHPIKRPKPHDKLRFKTCPKCGAERKTLYRIREEFVCFKCLKERENHE